MTADQSAVRRRGADVHVDSNSGHVEWLEFPALTHASTPTSRLFHGIFTRRGGFSVCSPDESQANDQAISRQSGDEDDDEVKSRDIYGYTGLNVGLSVGDDLSRVWKNRRAIAQVIGAQRLHYAKQVHGDVILEVNPESQECVGVCDGLMTNHKGVALMILHSDCQAAIFFDPKNEAIACVHSGWRGQVQDIYGKTLAAMKKTYGTRPADVVVCISPSLGPLSSEFVNFKSEFPPEFWRFQVDPLRIRLEGGYGHSEQSAAKNRPAASESDLPLDGSSREHTANMQVETSGVAEGLAINRTSGPHFDLWALSRWLLERSGVDPSHEHIAGICTSANEDDWYSYRRSVKRKQPCGRNCTVVMLK